MRTVLDQAFFDRSAVEVASDLLGKFLVSRLAGEEQARMIVETEGYHGMEDEACHAHFGKTSRTAVMFGPPGYRYPYLCYGVHWLLNVITGPGEHPGGVLIRGIEGVIGPGRVTKLVGVTKSQYALPVAPETGLWLEERGVEILPTDIISSPRVGVDYAGKHRRDMPWRFRLKEHIKKTA